MVGIYKLINIITNQLYIGQSKDLAKRLEEHFYHRTASNASLIDKAIGYYGIQNFLFQIIEICDEKDLDWKEDYYIRFFQSNIYGYNIVAGGQHNMGESNANVKLSANDVYFIRESYMYHKDPNEIFNTYFKGKISIMSFFNIWEGKCWPNIHMDVYTDENKKYYANLSYSKNEEKLNLSDEEILRLRKLYVNKTAEEVYNSENLTCNFNSFKSMLTGCTHKNVPIYKKKENKWIGL